MVDDGCRYNMEILINPMDNKIVIVKIMVDDG